MKKLDDGKWQTTVDLEPGKSFEFRYLIDGSRWENDWAADRYLRNEYGNENSVIETPSLQAAAPKKAAKQAPPKRAAAKKAAAKKTATNEPAAKKAAAKKAPAKQAPAKKTGRKPDADKNAD
jgi:hypothetical protein